MGLLGSLPLLRTNPPRSISLSLTELCVFVSVVGEKEKASGTVNIRTRDNKVHGERTVGETVERLQQLKQLRSKQAEEEF